jgi:hypothetical protein
MSRTASAPPPFPIRNASLLLKQQNPCLSLSHITPPSLNPNTSHHPSVSHKTHNAITHPRPPPHNPTDSTNFTTSSAPCTIIQLALFSQMPWLFLWVCCNCMLTPSNQGGAEQITPPKLCNNAAAQTNTARLLSQGVLLVFLIRPRAS